MKVVREIELKVCEPELFKAWVSLQNSVDEIVGNNEGTIHEKSFNPDLRRMIAQYSYPSLENQETASKEIDRFLCRHGVETQVVRSKDLLWEKLAKTAGVI